MKLGSLTLAQKRLIPENGTDLGIEYKLASGAVSAAWEKGNLAPEWEPGRTAILETLKTSPLQTRRPLEFKRRTESYQETIQPSSSFSFNSSVKNLTNGLIYSINLSDKKAL